MKGGDNCEKGLEEKHVGERSVLLAERQIGSCKVCSEEMPQVKELKGLGPNVASLQHSQRQADRVFALSA